MAFTRSIVVAGVIGLLVIHVLTEEHVVPRDMWENADQFLQDFIKAVQAAINVANTEYENIQQNATSIRDEQLQIIDTTYANVTERLETAVAEIRSQQTEETREQLESCISEYSSEMTRLVGYQKDLISTCMAALQSNISVELSDARTKSGEYLEVADDLRADIDACHVATDGEECISRVVIEILLLTLEIPTNIEELTRRTSSILDVYIEEIPVCRLAWIGNLAVVSNSVISNMRYCASLILEPEEKDSSVN